MASQEVSFRNPGAAQAGGYVLALAGVLVAIGLIFHPLPSGGFEEKPSVLAETWWWGAIHVAIALGFVFCVLGGLLVLISGSALTAHWTGALSWGALTVGMIFFTGVPLVNAYVMHFLSDHAAKGEDPLLFDAFNKLLVGYGWLGNPLFLLSLTGIALLELKHRTLALPRWLAVLGVICALFSGLRGIGSATGLYFLEPFVLANIPAFLWLGSYGLRIAWLARQSSRPGSTSI
jgi:hypothetical protein